MPNMNHEFMERILFNLAFDCREISFATSTYAPLKKHTLKINMKLVSNNHEISLIYQIFQKREK